MTQVTVSSRKSITLITNLLHELLLKQRN